MARKIKIITSDMHLSAGLFVDGVKNPHEDFFFDREFIEFLEFFSSGEYGDGCEVELVLNGDILDFLNVTVEGDFVDLITEKIALEKLKKILHAHKEVVKALQSFCAKTGKKITYNIGNHDMDFFFPAVRKHFCEVIGGKNYEGKIWVNAEEEFLEYPEGIEIHHGNQFEAVHRANYQNPFISDDVPEPILFLPWGSVYVLKIINRLKWERDYLDKVKPARLFLLFGLLTDPLFMVRFFFLSFSYFIKTRFIYSPRRRATIRNAVKIMKEEITPFYGLDEAAREILDRHVNTKIVIIGHTHGPVERHFRDGKTYINTGTWTRMINLDLRQLGQNVRLTFGLVEYDEQMQPGLHCGSGLVNIIPIVTIKVKLKLRSQITE